MFPRIEWVKNYDAIPLIDAKGSAARARLAPVSVHAATGCASGEGDKCEVCDCGDCPRQRKRRHGNLAQRASRAQVKLRESFFNTPFVMVFVLFSLRQCVALRGVVRWPLSVIRCPLSVGTTLVASPGASPGRSAIAPRVSVGNTRARDFEKPRRFAGAFSNSPTRKRGDCARTGITKPRRFAGAFPNCPTRERGEREQLR